MASLAAPLLLATLVLALPVLAAPLALPDLGAAPALPGPLGHVPPAALEEARGALLALDDARARLDAALAQRAP